MKKLNNQYLFLSISMFAIAIASMYVIFFVDNSFRYLITAAVSIVIVIVSIYLAKKTGTIINYETDERDIINIEKSSRKTLQLISYITSGIIFFCLTIYSATKSNVFLLISMTELGTLIIIIIMSLITQKYYEKRN